MSDRYDRTRSRRGVWSHWVPLVVTVTVATVGLAAWAWSQRKGEEESDAEEMEHEPGLDYDNADYGDNPAYGTSADDYRATASGPGPQMRDAEGLATGYAPPPAEGVVAAGSTTWGDRVSGALRRTPSPQQFLDSAGKKVAAGAAAAGAVVGKALASIREEDKAAYADHETWSEEAETKKDKAAGSGPGRPTKAKDDNRRVVAVVVSADGHAGDFDDDGFHEHAVRPPLSRPWAFRVRN